MRVCVRVFYVCDCGIAGLEQRDGVLSDKERKKLRKHYKSLAKKLRGHSDLLGVAGLCVRAYVYVFAWEYVYGVATISRLLKFIGLFCKRAL